MSMTDIAIDQINPDLGIVLGNPESEITLVEYINLKCPYCKQWWDEKSFIIDEALNSNSIKYVIKLFNKEKPSLAKGNVMHQYVPNNSEALNVIGKIYDTQSLWGSLETISEIEHFAEHHLNLVKQPTASLLTDILEETKKTNVFFIPTMIIGTQVFDQKISETDFRKLLKN